ncbi:hypothetical protein CDL12_01351 [Handroanthus impetiginosus]|uniref:Uncharacterized protein n=1 Tax=Handroanthus impetiginosus TaxID=429701 RepID=A0A2G9I851_9LAMI|nr:hypothetical protein CDL12_01351 [Handroanthus impetiginosus]
MASSSYSKTLLTSCRINFTILFLGFLLANTWNSCIATRPGRMMMMMKEEDASLMALKHFQEQEKLPPELYFAKLPKGVPIPPSAPSKRHNSSPQN